MSNTPVKLNIYDLYRNINEKKEKKYVNYNEVLYKIHDKIKRTSDKEKLKIVYEIPEMIFGLPTYNLNHCMAYIIKQLRNNGFLVKYYFPKILYISWDPREIKDYKKNKNNIKNNLKNLQQQNNQVYDPRNYFTPKNYNQEYEQEYNNRITNNNNTNRNSNKNPNSNIDFTNQLDLIPPESTQHNNSIFKPILNYDPNNIPTYNYYAYSTLNNNLVNENFYINNKPEDFNKFKKTSNTIEMPEHIKQLKIQDDYNNIQEQQQKQQFNENYQRDILDYYNDDMNDSEEHPFKNTIKKYNSKGKFVLDLT